MNSEAHRSRPWPIRWGKSLGSIILTIYIALMLMLVLLETQLVYPAPKYPRGDWSPQGLGQEEVHFKSADGVALHGWFLDHPAPRGYLLYCHGNGEHVAHQAELLAFIRREYQLAVFAFDYRGYGRSDGSPHEAGVLLDGWAAQQWLATRKGIPPDQVILWGRSLGGGVAVDLAAKNGAKALVLESTFSSITDVAAHQFWWAPVRLLMRNRYESATKIVDYNGPLFQSHGTSDSVVPLRFGRRLHEACPSDIKYFHEVPGGDHNDPRGEQQFEALRTFFEELATADAVEAQRQAAH